MSRILLFGPPLSGKRTLMRQYAHSHGVSIRKITRDYGAEAMPHEISCAVVAGIELVTIGGAVWNIDAWRSLLADSAAVVLVVDSQVAREAENCDHLNALVESTHLPRIGCAVWSKDDLVTTHGVERARLPTLAANESDSTRDREQQTHKTGPYRAPQHQSNAVVATWPTFSTRFDSPQSMRAPIAFLVSQLEDRVASRERMSERKDRPIRDLVVALDLDVRDWVVVDHWEADRCAIGIASRRDLQRLVYVSSFGKPAGRFDCECEAPSETGRDVSLPELIAVLERHFRTGLLVHELVAWASYDFVCLAELPYYAERLGATDASTQREWILLALKELLTRELWSAGALSKSFLPWEGSPNGVAARIEREWLAHSGQLDPGEISWFANTPSGDSLAHQLHASGFRSVMEDEDED